MVPVLALPLSYDFKWIILTLYRLVMLVGDNVWGEVHQGLGKLVEHHTLMDMTNARSKEAN